MEKRRPNTTKAHIHQSKQMYYITKYTQKTKSRLSHLLRHPVLKWRGPIFISALDKFVTYLLTQALTHLLTAPDPCGAATHPQKFSPETSEGRSPRENWLTEIQLENSH